MKIITGEYDQSRVEVKPLFDETTEDGNQVRYEPPLMAAFEPALVTTFGSPGS